ncbi:MAG: AraC family transcriptional regulator, partial [Bryobacteraceae bacterium]|nr:AraC family transcriptional regulator [Bryobacteraceae bacterium]
MEVVLPPIVDPVGEALQFLRISGTFYCLSEFTAPWSLDVPPINRSLMLHVVTSGRCWVETKGRTPRLVQTGDLALVPHGDGHVMSSEPGLPAVKLFDLPRVQASERYEHVRMGGGGEPSNLICSLFQFDHPAAHHLIELLPHLIVVNACNSPHADWVLSTLRLMETEARELRPGSETVITRLADILVIHAVRCWIEQEPSAQTGWLGALRDPQIGRIIARIHRQPELAWTLETLAAEAAMSRSAFAARFTELLGEPAMHYVARWRMLTGLSWLREGDATVGEIALRLNYESEAAF